jgi:hypothetical protein
MVQSTDSHPRCIIRSRQGLGTVPRFAAGIPSEACQFNAFDNSEQSGVGGCCLRSATGGQVWRRRSRGLCRSVRVTAARCLHNDIVRRLVKRGSLGSYGSRRAARRTLSTASIRRCWTQIPGANRIMRTRLGDEYLDSLARSIGRYRPFLGSPKVRLSSKTTSRLIVVPVLMMLALLTTYPANAAAIHDCGRLDSIGNLVGNVRSFAQGAIRVAYISTEEPAAAPEHLLIFVEEGSAGARCFAVSATADGRGFAAIDFKALEATYNSDKGLLISIPATTDPSLRTLVSTGRIKVRVDRRQGNNAVSIER